MANFCWYYFLNKQSAHLIFLKIILTNPLEMKFARMQIQNYVEKVPIFPIQKDLFETPFILYAMVPQ